MQNCTKMQECIVNKRNAMYTLLMPFQVPPHKSKYRIIVLSLWCHHSLTGTHCRQVRSSVHTNTNHCLTFCCFRFLLSSRSFWRRRSLSRSLSSSSSISRCLSLSLSRCRSFSSSLQTHRFKRNLFIITETSDKVASCDVSASRCHRVVSLAAWKYTCILKYEIISQYFKTNLSRSFSFRRLSSGRFRLSKSSSLAPSA